MNLHLRSGLLHTHTHWVSVNTRAMCTFVNERLCFFLQLCGMYAWHISRNCSVAGKHTWAQVHTVKGVFLCSNPPSVCLSEEVTKLVGWNSVTALYLFVGRSLLKCSSSWWTKFTKFGFGGFHVRTLVHFLLFTGSNPNPKEMVTALTCVFIKDIHQRKCHCLACRQHITDLSVKVHDTVQEGEENTNFTVNVKNVSLKQQVVCKK